MNPARLPLLILAFLLAAIPRTASAQKRDASSADALFQAARDAMAKNDVATACARFAESHRLDPAPGTLLNLAQCEEKQGKLATSHAHLGEALESLPANDFRVAYARKELAALKPRVPTVTLTLDRSVAGARATRDDVELGESAFGVALPLDPGVHVFVVRAPGRADAREELTVREGQRASLTLFAGAVTRSLPAAAGRAQPAAPKESSDGRRTAAIAAWSVGGAGLVTGIVTGLLFRSAAGTYDQQCNASGCTDEGLAAASRMKTLDVVSPVAFGVAALGLGTGTYLWLTARSGTGKGSVGIAPAVSPQLAGLALSGGF